MNILLFQNSQTTLVLDIMAELMIWNLIISLRVEMALGASPRNWSAKKINLP